MNTLTKVDQNRAMLLSLEKSYFALIGDVNATPNMIEKARRKVYNFRNQNGLSEIAQTIIEQVKILVPKHRIARIVVDGPDVKFILPGQNAKRVIVKYNHGADNYSVREYKLNRGLEIVMDETTEGVYCDMLEMFFKPGKF